MSKIVERLKLGRLARNAHEAIGRVRHQDDRQFRSFSMQRRQPCRQPRRRRQARSTHAFAAPATSPPAPWRCAEQRPHRTSRRHRRACRPPAAPIRWSAATFSLSARARRLSASYTVPPRGLGDPWLAALPLRASGRGDPPLYLPTTRPCSGTNDTGSWWKPRRNAPPTPYWSRHSRQRRTHAIACFTIGVDPLFRAILTSVMLLHEACHSIDSPDAATIFGVSMVEKT
jgi:hypothetical protein